MKQLIYLLVNIRKLAQKDYKCSCVGIGKVIHWEFYCWLKFDNRKIIIRWDFLSKLREK